MTTVTAARGTPYSSTTRRRSYATPASTRGSREPDISRAERLSVLLVVGAQRQFEKRAPYRELEPGLRTDVRHFFGDYATWQANARAILFDVGNLAHIDAACREAADEGHGWLE